MKLLSAEFTTCDHRRSLTQLLTTDIKQVNTYEVTKNAVLGNHYHKETYEYFFITKGTFLLQLDKDGSRVFNKGDLFVVEPGENHIIECMSKGGSFMTFLSKPYSKEDPDTFKVPS